MSTDAISATAGPAARTAYEGCVERIFEHNPITKSLFIRMPAGRLLSFIPGQFISISIPLGEGARVRPYTIASAPEENDLLEICFDLVPNGAASHHLFALKIGAMVRFTGPFGLFTLDQPLEAETIFIAEGTAAAPARPMVRRALSVSKDGPPIRLIHAASSDSGLVYRGEFEALARANERFAFEPLIAGPISGAAGCPLGLKELVTRRYVAGNRDLSRRFFISGIGKAVIELRDLLRGAGYERRAVKYEQW